MGNQITAQQEPGRLEAIEAARRVGAEPVGALARPAKRAGLRVSQSVSQSVSGSVPAGARTDASSKRPASSEGDRRAEEGSTALHGPARLPSSS